MSYLPLASQPMMPLVEKCQGFCPPALSHLRGNKIGRGLKVEKIDSLSCNQGNLAITMLLVGCQFAVPKIELLLRSWVVEPGLHWQALGWAAILNCKGLERFVESDGAIHSQSHDRRKAARL